jgi:hypothetical protein
MRAYNQWLVYKLVPREDGKTDKLPLDYRTGRLPPRGEGGATIWTDHDTAQRVAAQLGAGHGVGFSFAASDPYFFVDIDKCLQADGTWSPLAQQLVAAFPGAYIEVSQSGRGLHIIGRGTPPPHACKNTTYGLELYHADRFVALTGYGAQGNPDTECGHVLPWLVSHFFPPAAGDGALVDWTDSPVPEWYGPTDDTDLIRRAMQSRSAASVFGTRATFADLWTGDERALSQAFPDAERPFDESSADAALAQHLAFWTGKNCERIQALMFQSALVRDKWQREDYLPRTITKAVSRQVDVLRDKPVEVVQAVPATGAEALVPSCRLVTGNTFLNPEEQMGLFTGCVYVSDIHRVLVPGGVLVKPDQFKVKYGGYSFIIDSQGERVVRDAWEAFTQSQVYRAPHADRACFEPAAPPAALLTREGETLVNTYWPVATPRRAGDAKPFMDHLTRLLPVARDRDILLAYMAACVQHKGVKFQWAPLIQGVEGNGKSLLTRCVAFAIGERYTHFPKASQIAEKFNGWMQGRIFIGVEDVYVPESQREVLEELKPMITNERIEIERKGVDQATMGVCCNFILNCNDKGAMRKSRNDRRLALFYTAQQEKEHLGRDSMTDGYFQRLYAWLRSGGYEIVNELLHTHVIPDEFNPAHGHIAPITSSTDEALTHGLGHVEQEILEAIERDEPGFRGGWVSSMAVDKLLERAGRSRSIPQNKRRDLLLNIGYDWHPALNRGRVNSTVLPDGGKPRLFVLRNSSLREILTPADVASAYAIAQQAPVG